MTFIPSGLQSVPAAVALLPVEGRRVARLPQEFLSVDTRPKQLSPPLFSILAGLVVPPNVIRMHTERQRVPALSGVCTPSVKQEGACRRGPLSVHGAPTWHLAPGNIYLWGSGGGSTRPWPRVAPAAPCPHCCPRLSWCLRIGAFPPRLLGQNRWESKFVLGSAGLYTLCSSWPVYDRWLIADSSGSSSRNSKDVGISRSAETSSDD